MGLHEWLTLAGMSGSVLLGTSLQRTTGVGFALVASPFLVAVLGPFNGVLVVNLFGTIAALIVFLRVFRQVEYARVAWLLIPALIGVVPGAWVAMAAPADLLSIVIGAVIVLALIGSFFAQRSSVFAGRPAAGVAGMVSGFMNVTAGVGGPAVSAYAIASRWPQSPFAASVQLYFCVLGIASLAAKWSLPRLDAVEWIACIVAVALGVVIGEWTSRRVSPAASRRAVIVLAFAGAFLILMKGVVEWSTR